jgi:tetratricopeptide (TPR) repeat protein
MSNEAKEYNVATIQQLLLAAFTPKTLRRFCRKHPTFRPILNEFSPDHGLSDMVDEVITYCETNLLIPELLAEVRRANPRQYARYAGCLYAGQEPEPAGPVPPPSPPAFRQGVVDRLKETLGQHRRPIRIGIISLLALVVLSLLAIVIMAIIESRRTPEYYTDQFRRTTSPDVRVTALASLMKQPGHEQDPQLLFFGELAPEEQVSMWQISDPDGLQEEYAAVVGAIYTHLDNSPQSHLILQAIAGTLSRLESAVPEAIRDLQLEVKWWLEGQNRYSQGEYREALSGYDIAIAMNKQNAATYFERALVHVALEEHSSALLDLERVLRLDRARKEKVEGVIRDNASLFTYLGLHRAKYPGIASSFPTLTPTPTYTPTPTLTPTPTPTKTPTVTPTPTVPVPTTSVSITAQIASVYVDVSNNLHVVLDAICTPYRLYVWRQGQTFGDLPSHEYYRIWELADCPKDLLVVIDVEPETIYCVELQSDDAQVSYDLTSYRTGKQTKPFAGEIVQDGACPIESSP